MQHKLKHTSEFSDWLNTEMRKRNLSQADLARMAGVTRSAINGILTGARNPGVKLCTGIAQALVIDPTFVFRRAGLLAVPQSDEMNRAIEFNAWLDFELSKRKWTGNRLAVNAKISPSVISKIRQGKLASWDACKSIADALDIPPVSVFQNAGLLPDENTIHHREMWKKLLSQLSARDIRILRQFALAMIREKETD